MTEKEWPIVEGMIARIDPTLSEGEARAELQKVAAYMGKIKSNARDAYNTEWGNTQYVKPQLGGGKQATKAINPADMQAAEWVKANPNDPRAAAIKQRLGL